MYVKYIEAGYSVMPIDAQTGTPLIQGWDAWSDKVPDIELAEEWENKYPIGDRYGIAVICGAASGIEILDIDTDDPRVHAICPKSICGKVGTPGRAAYAFRWNEQHKNISEGKTGVGLYHSKKYHIIPPSLHRKTKKPYKWTGTALIDMDFFDFSDLDLSFYSSLDSNVRESSHNEGRNNKLKDIVCAMRSRGETEENIVKEIYEYDMLNHRPRLFMDPKENYRAKSESEAKLCALRLVSSVTSSLLKQKDPQVLLPDNKTVEINLNVSKFIPRPIPVYPEGLIAAFVQAANASSKFDITSLAVGGAISYLSAIASNRVKVRRASPVTYVLSLAKSGTGKGTVVDMLKEVFEDTDLLGSDMYRSTQGFVQSLPQQQTRLDVLDEAAPFFESMKSTSSFVSDLADIVNRMFSIGLSHFGGISSVKHGMKAGASNNPHVNIYATTHQDGFLQSITGYMGSSGLLPRFLVFEQTELKLNPKGQDMLYYAGITFLKSFRDSFWRQYPLIHDGQIDVEKGAKPKTKPHSFEFERDALMAFEVYEASKLQWIIDNQDHYERPYVSRLGEYVEKLSLLTAISNSHKTILETDVRYAIELTESCYYNASLIRSEVARAGRITGPIAKVENAIRKRGQVTRTELIKVTDLPSRELNEALTALIEDGIVQEVAIKGRFKPTKVYIFHEKDAKQ